MTYRIQLFLLGAFLLALLPNMKGQSTLATIEATIDRYAKANDIPAISVGIISDGKTTYLNRGTYDRTTDRAVDEHGLYQLASLSKTFTAIIINHLIHEGRMQPEESITAYLPSDYSVKTRAKLQPITVRDLLHHRSGLPRDSWVTRNMRKGNDPLIYNYTAADFKTDLDRMKVRPRPGSKYRYSNFGFALLGYLAEQVTGLSYEELLQTYVCTPYDLTMTSTEIKAAEQQVTPYRKEDRQVETQAFVLGKLTPPSGIFSSTYDLTRLLQNQMEIYRAQEETSDLYLSKDTRSSTKEADSESRYGYGLGNFGSEIYGHGGDIDGYACDYWFYPKFEVACVILTSSGGDWVDELSMDINKILVMAADVDNRGFKFKKGAIF